VVTLQVFFFFIFSFPSVLSKVTEWFALKRRKS
jgi:hypothetical protein